MQTKRRGAPWVTSPFVLQVRNLAIDVAARRVLSDASFTVAAGDKVGLVGRNGVGKTSLLKVLAEENDAAAGLVLRRGTLGYVPQNPRPRAEAAQTALSHILSGRGLDKAGARLQELHRQLEADHSSATVERFSEAEERFRLDGGYSGESDARRIATGLGLKPDRVDLALGVLSGGERRRVELARVLFAEPDLILLDEPRAAPPALAGRADPSETPAEPELPPHAAATKIPTTSAMVTRNRFM